MESGKWIVASRWLEIIIFPISLGEWCKDTGSTHHVYLGERDREMDNTHKLSVILFQTRPHTLYSFFIFIQSFYSVVRLYSVSR